MSLQVRIFLATALCALLFFVSQLFVPEPTPEQLAAQKAEAEKKAEAEAQPDEPADAEEAEAPPAIDPAAPAAVAVDPWDGTLRNDLLALAVTNRAPARGGVVASVELLSSQFQGHATATDSLGLDGKRTLEIGLSDGDGNPLVARDTAYAVREATAERLVLEHASGSLVVTERLELLSGYEARLEVEVHNRGTATLPHQVHLRTRIGVSDSQYDVRYGLCRTVDDLEWEDNGDVEDGPVSYTDVLWSGVTSKYFATLVVPQERLAGCEVVLAKGGAAIENDVTTVVDELAPGQTKTHVFGLYIGPKELERLQAFAAVGTNVPLDASIDWGFFGGVSEWLGKLLLALLRWFHELVSNWGIAIVLLTITVKAVTLPLTLKQMSSMKRMKEIQPEMNKIKEKYADDRVKQGQEMQALFARSGVNPLAGCLPMLVQLPIWFALYSMLGAAVELVHEPFLWLPDLTEQDPYYILPLALGALMIVQNRMMPSTMDPAQAKLMRWVMPIMFTVFMLFLPSGLGVYIFANIVLSLVQTAIQVGTNKNPEAPAT
jgi:YidC/Oxa1 family membrane protein insertase